MSSSLFLDIIRHTHPDNSNIVRSHILHPDEDITIICMMSAQKENIVSVLEDHLLESISSTEWKKGDEESDFAYVTERYNVFQRNLSQADLKGNGGLFAIIRGDHLMISVIGDMCAILREQNGNITTISENTEDSFEFLSVSNGKIPTYGQVFFSSQPILSILGDQFLEECEDLPRDSFKEILGGILERDTTCTIHVVHLGWEKKGESKKGYSPFFSSRKSGKQIDIGRGYFKHIQNILSTNKFMGSIFDKLHTIFLYKHTHILILFFLIGATLFFGLVYTLIRALFEVNNTPQVSIKNQILEAKTLIEESQKLTSNSEAFNKNIEAAEDILFHIRDKQEYMKDTQDLLQRIEAMKKEMYDIQTVDLKKRESIMKFNPADISPITLFESNKKLNLIGKNSAIFGYTPGNPLPSISPYPPGEEAIDGDMTEEGNFYLLTKNNRVLSTKRNEVTYVNVTGQESWENALKIQTFNNNIYLIDTIGGQIFKHKPGVNGFSQKSEVLTNTLSGILDVGIDGGFYILTNEPKIYRMISKEGFSQNGITLNKIPGEYTIGNNEITQIVVRTNLNFIYILSGDKVWIFEPDSKRFQDVTSWTYLAQLEIATDENIRSISVPRDGLIYAVTNLGVYNISFEFIDKNIILKN